MPYKSTIDNQTFQTKEELIQHMLEVYTVEVLSTEQEKIIQEIEEAVPFVTIDINSKKETEPMELFITYYSKEDEFLDSETILVGSSENEEQESWGYRHFKQVRDAIGYLKLYYDKSDEIQQFLRKEYGIASYKLVQIFTGSYQERPQLTFRLAVDNEHHNVTHYFTDDMEVLQKQFDAIFKKEIEGEVESYWENDELVFRVNGVELQTFLRNGKKARITLLD